MVWLKFIFNALEIVIFTYLAVSVLYFFIMAIAGFFKYRKPRLKTEHNRKVAILIPAYKEDQVIVNTAQKACTQSYPDDLYDVFVISDSLHEETLLALKRTKAKVIEVFFKNRTKAKALNAAVQQIGTGYNIALVLDADNVMEDDFLVKINDFFNRGFVAVQGHRVAKNLNNSLAILDAMSEEVNNHLFRKSHRVLGLSSALIGSGMAFDFMLFSTIIARVDSVAEDKEIEFSLLKSGYRIAYLDDAFVYDEKTQRSDDFVNQRSRWLGMQIMSLKKYFVSGFVELFTNFNVDYFDRVMQMLLPPRILAIGFLSILVVIESFILLLFPSVCEICIVPFYFWVILWAVLAFVIAISIPLRLYNKQSLMALLTLPKGLLLMLVALFKSKDSTKDFVHTKHYGSDGNE